MTYSMALADRVRRALVDYDTEEKRMFGSLAFMVNGKMCMSVGQDRLMCRLLDDDYTTALTIEGIRPMIHAGRTMQGYVFVPDAQIGDDTSLMQWVKKALACNASLRETKRPRH